LDNDGPQSKCFLGFVKFLKDFLVPIINFPGGQYYKVFRDNPTQYACYLVGLLIVHSLIGMHKIDGGEYACKAHDVMKDLVFHIIEFQTLISFFY
jgi:hypothetical protein